MQAAVQLPGGWSPWQAGLHEFNIISGNPFGNCFFITDPLPWELAGHFYISAVVQEPGGDLPQHLLLDPPPKPPCEKLLDPDPQDFISEEVHEPGGSEPQHLPAPELELELEQAFISEEVHEPGGSEPQHFVLDPPKPP